MAPLHRSPFLLAVLAVPAVWGIPRLCLLLGGWLDQILLNRPFPPSEAEDRLTESLRGVRDEDEAISVATAQIGRLVGSAVAIDRRAPAEVDASAFVDTQQEPKYWLVVRQSQSRPFFSQDHEMLGMLARILAFALDNLRIESRRRDLALEASRSELKALPAQVNPHFLFNSLNTVAGLIPLQPEKAEAVVERLADVFRYTLRRTNSEWARLGEELDYVRAWLEVEQARYGERLEYSIEAQEPATQRNVPAMVVLTLVENAVKHGVAKCAGHCAVGVRAELTGSRLVVEVRDSGPGPSTPPGEGVGLQNVSRRLRSHYGDAAVLTLERDEALHETIARIVIPSC